MFIKMSGKESSELITELFICSFVSPVMQTVQIAPGNSESCTATLMAFWPVNMKYESFTRTSYAY